VLIGDRKNNWAVWQRPREVQEPVDHTIIAVIKIELRQNLNLPAQSTGLIRAKRRCVYLDTVVRKAPCGAEAR
jgi:hypothetical protein